jgi:hypothetical protein
MNFNDLLLILLSVIFIILSIFYIVKVCDYNIKEFFAVSELTNIEKSGCNLDNTFNNCSDSSCKYTDSFIIKDEEPINYHNDYTCDMIEQKYRKKYADIDNKNLLLTYKCIKNNPRKFKELLEKKGIETSSVLEYRTNNLKNLTDYIKTEIVNKIKNTKLHTSKWPIYACISQAPYLKNGLDNTVVWDYNRGQQVDYRYSCSIGVTENNIRIPCSANQEMYYEILLIFLKNDKNNIDDFIKIIKDSESSNLQCNINCGNSFRMEGLTCGCLNKESSYDSYNSVCKTGNTVQDYSIVYYINNHHNFDSKDLNIFIDFT